MLKPGQELTFEDRRSTAEARSGPEETAGDDSSVPTSVTSHVVRGAAIILLILFVMPWGSVWISTECTPRSDTNTLGTVSGWDLATGKEFELPTPTGRSVSTVSIKAQPEAFIIPLIGLTIIGVSLLARAGTRRQRTAGMYIYYLLAFVGSIACQMAASNVIGGVSVPPDQTTTLAPASSAPSLTFDGGGVLAIQFLTLSTLGICGIVGVLRMKPIFARNLVETESDADEAWYRAQLAGRPPS